MTRESAVRKCREELDKHELTKEWHIRLITDINKPFLGLCSYKDKCIILNAHHIDIHPDVEIEDTIKHEVAHALTPGNGHNEVWRAKAVELGCSPSPCRNLSLSPEIIDAIRSGAEVLISFEEETVRRAKYEITRLQDKCKQCGKVVITDRELLIPRDDTQPDDKIIFLKCGHCVFKKIPKGTPFHLLRSDQSCKHNDWDRNTCKMCGAHRPFPFQVDGMRFIESSLAQNKGAAIFDEMGLGKTIQALGYLKFHSESLPVLYIVKSAIKFQWFKQIITWMGDEFVGQIISSSSDMLIPGLKTYIISYDMLVYKERRSRTGKIIKQGFDITKFDGIIKTVILDECQQIKNPDSSRTQQVRRIVKDKQVIALSGTPWKNRGSEFFSVLNMMAPFKFSSYANYVKRWVDTYWDGNKLKEGGIRNIPAFREYTKDIVIRREVNEVMSELPDVNRMRLDVQLDDLSQNTYNDEVSEFVKWYNQFIIDGTEDEINGMHILAKLSRMRHITGLAKIEATEAFVEEFVESNDRHLTIFVHHKDVGSILYDSLKSKYPNMLVLKLTGEQGSQERFEIQEKFQNSKRALLVASTLASGEGINLQVCGDAIMHERQWNPQNENQAAPGRFRRIGSTSKVINVTFMTAEGTVDDILHEIVEKKRVQFHNSMNKGEAEKWDESSIAKELAEGIIKRFKQGQKTKNPKFSELVKM